MCDEPTPMSSDERSDRFCQELDRLLDYWVAEYDATMLEVVGVLEIAKLNRAMVQFKLLNDDEDAEDESV